MNDALTLPDLDALDHAALKAMAFEQHSEHKASRQELSSRKGEIEHLKLLVEKLRHMLFGVKSEKVLRQIEQLELKLEELESVNAAERRTATATRDETTKPFRRPLPEHLPREVHTHMFGG